MRGTAGTARRVALLCSLAACGGADGRRPHVLVISCDSLRPDHLGCYDYRTATGKPTSPNFDALARDGVVFLQARSTTTWTMPAHQALFTGAHDLLHGAVDNDRGPSPDLTRLPVRLRELGYHTVGYYSGPYLHPAYGFGAGFDVYEAVDDAEQEVPAAPLTAAERERCSHLAFTADDLRRRAQAELRAQAEAGDDAPPLFLFLHFFDVHYDYRPREEGFALQFRPDDWRARPVRVTGDQFLENPAIHAGMAPEDLADVQCYYDAEVYWTDQQVGAILDTLKELRLDGETLVCLVSDHGDEFFEHGTKGHRQNLYDATLRVVWLLRGPGVPAGRRVDTPVSLVDVAPTLLDLVGAAAPAPAGAVGFGRSVRAAWTGSQPAGGEAAACLLSPMDRPGGGAREWSWALWTGRYKVVVRWTPGADDATGGVQGEVYDLALDPGERVNLAGSRDPQVRAAIDRYDAVFADLFRQAQALRPGSAPRFASDELDDHLSRLRAEGYVEADDETVRPPPAPAFPRGG